MRFAWIDEPPFNYVEDGRLRGRDVELAQRAFAAIGEEFEPVETEFGELLGGLSDGRWDVTTGMFITQERMARAAFTRPIWSLRDGLLVRQDWASRVTGYRSLAAMRARLAVLRGQMQIQTALRCGVRQSDLMMFDRYADAADAVLQGTATAYASVELAHVEHIGRSGNASLVCIPVQDDEKLPDVGGFACASVSVRDRLNAALELLLKL